ncbi:metallopeptidase [Nocardia sp. CNY236]|uniref:metallopeptidase n=1 Tax=Nocardia sp. CNY236 TaxID=1169152 RepID=UPI0003F7DA76|nr:metallopeptidase [Nocardia sp. CNY236]
MPKVRTPVFVTALVGALLLVGGCAQHVDSTAISIYDDPFKVAGLPMTSGPSGPRSNVPDSTLTAVNGDGGAVDTLALNAVDDIQNYWRGVFPEAFQKNFEPVDRLLSWSATAPRATAVEFCGQTTRRLVNAAYCPVDNSIGWDRSILLPAMEKTFGKMAVVMVLAHEYGHAVHTLSQISGRRDPGIVKEQQADCLAGAFIRHVAEGKAEHFTINTSEGLNSVLAASVALRDSDPDDPANVHGSAFERVTAVQIGFTDGPTGCAGIDEDEIDQRRANLPQSFRDDGGRGEFPITRESLAELTKALHAILPAGDEPSYDYSGNNRECANGVVTKPVSYCPDTNTITTDVPRLAERGVVEIDGSDLLPVEVTGDYNGYIVFVSRYTLAVQHSRGQDLSGAKTGLQAACLSGVITSELAESDRPISQGDIRLSAGDLDEAVSGLLTDGLAASDVRGQTVRSGFSRIDAFRAGVINGEQACMSRYS